MSSARPRQTLLAKISSLPISSDYLSINAIILICELHELKSCCQFVKMLGLEMFALYRGAFTGGGGGHPLVSFSSPP